MTAVVESKLPLPLLRRGKVREVYEVDAQRLLMIASDRISAFDVVMNEAVPDKGAVLTQISAFWFDTLNKFMNMRNAGQNPDKRTTTTKTTQVASSN